MAVLRQPSQILSVKNELLASLAFLAITSVFGWRLSFSAGSAVDSLAADEEFKSYTFLFRGEKIVDTRLPLPGAEMK